MISSHPTLFPPDLTKILPFEEVERQTLAHALKVMDNNVTQAAQALNIAFDPLSKIEVASSHCVGLRHQKVCLKPIFHVVKHEDWKVDLSRFLITA